VPATAAGGEPASPHFTHRETVVIITGLMLGMFLAALDQTIVATALPRISGDLNGAGHLSWVVSAYLLTSTAATPIYGKLSDLYGRKLMLQAAIVIFLITSVLCAVAGSMGQLIAFRALQGLGGGGLLAMAHATIADVLSPRERGRYQGYFAGVFAAASVIGPVLGGLFADYLSWRWVFWINLPIGFAALAVSQFALRRLVVKRLRHKIDYLGALLIVAGVCCVLLVTTMGGNEAAWDSPLIEGLAGGALVLFGLCVLQERHASEPILPPRLFRNPVFAVANFLNLMVSAVMIGSIVFVPLFLQLVYGMTAGNSGLMLIPLSGATTIGAVSAGRLVAATGRYKLLPIIGLASNLAGMVLFSTVTASTPLILTGAYMVLAGIGLGAVMPVMLVAIQNAIEVRDLGTGTASNSFFRSMGGSFGVALFGAVLLARLNSAVGSALGSAGGRQALGPDPGSALLHAGAEALRLAPAALQPAIAAGVTDAFHDVFRVGAGISLITLIAALFLKELPLRTTSGLADKRASGAAAALAAD
jgi:EmrB/QacA subfamily drug resistance transporter